MTQKTILTVREVRRWLDEQSGDLPLVFTTSDGLELEAVECWPTADAVHISLEERKINV